MPKYSINEVLEIIQNLTAEEKKLLQAQLPSVLEIHQSEQAKSIATQSQNFGNISASGSGSIPINQITSGGDTQLSQSNSQVKAKTNNLKDVSHFLKQLEQKIVISSTLNELEKSEAEAKIIFLQKELEKPQPNKNLIDQAIDGLRKGLQGVLELAEPVHKVAELIAQAWML